MLVLSVLTNLTTAALTTLPELTRPDCCECGAWYSKETDTEALPTLVDCIDAWDQLPEGSEPVMWFTDPEDIPSAPGGAPEFPLVRISGTCQTALFASGKRDLEAPSLALYVAADSLRQITLSTIENCVRRESRGGFATLDFANIIDWILADDTKFPGDLNMPADVTYFTAMVWNPRDVEGFDPGLYDPETTDKIANALREAAEGFQVGSRLEREFDGRYERVFEAMEVQKQEGGWELLHPWWAGK